MRPRETEQLRALADEQRRVADALRRYRPMPELERARRYLHSAADELDDARRSGLDAGPHAAPHYRIASAVRSFAMWAHRCSGGST